MKDMELKKEINILLWLRFPFWVPTCTRSYTPRGCKPFSSRQVGSSDSVCVCCGETTFMGSIIF